MRGAWVLAAVVAASLVGVPLAAPSDAASAQVEGNHYTSPHWGYTLEWDEDDWDVQEDPTPADQIDLLALHTGDSSLRLQGFPAHLHRFTDAQSGDPAACLDEFIEMIADDPAVRDVELAPDREAPQVELDDESAAAVYTYTREGQGDLIGYFACRALEEGETVLRISFISLAASYDTELPLAEAVLATLALPGLADATAAADDETPGAGPEDETPEAEDTPDTDTTDDATAAATDDGATVAAEDEVPMARGSPARTGEMPGPGPASEPAVRWSFAAEETVYTSPAVVAGIVYFGEAGSALDTGGRLYAVDAATGEEGWRFEAGGRQVSSPTVVDDVAYIGTEGGDVYAVDTATGEARWRVEAGGGHDRLTSGGGWRRLRRRRDQSPGPRRPQRGGGVALRG